MLRSLIALLCLVLCVYAVAGQEKFVMPVDEGPRDASFLAFRTKLIAAAERRDAKHIISILDPKIELSFGGHSGIADFRKLWKIDRKESKFWETFLPVIKNGGAFLGEGRNKYNNFSAPYTFSSWPEDVDGFEYHAIFGSNVNLREGPSTEARVIDQLSYNIVKVDDEASVKKKTGPHESEYEYVWVKVTTMGGKTGFVKADLVRSHIDYRAGFEKKRGGWKMTYFIAGD
jgi:hypothetical protein